MYLKTPALVLREAAYQDQDKILTLLTPEHGKMTVKARGVRRNGSTLKAACQLLAYGEFVLFENRGSISINEAQATELFPEIRGDIELLALGSYFAQAAELLSQEDSPSPELLSLTLNALFALARLKKPRNLVKAAFELRAACIAGYAPDLSGCSVCGDPDPDRFSLLDGTLECTGCRSTDGIRLPVTPGMLDAMRYIADCPASKLFSFRLDEATLKSLSSLTESFLSTQLEKSFSALAFYKSLFLQPEELLQGGT